MTNATERTRPQYYQLDVLFTIDFVNVQPIVDSLINWQLKQAVDYCNEYIQDLTEYDYTCDIYDIVELRKIVEEKYK